MKVNKKKKILFIIIGILFILILSIGIYVSKNNLNQDIKENKETNIEEEENAKNKDDEEKIKKLKKVSESERIRTYLGEYFNYLENKDYESAYNLLYPKFRENYFQDLDSYKKYLTENNYPDMYSINYNNIRTQGDYYIVNLDIGDLLDRDTLRLKIQNSDRTFIIKEEDYNKFYLSFKL